MLDTTTATHVSEENNVLRLRIAQLRAEEQERCAMCDQPDSSDMSVIDKLRARNNALHERIAEQERRLGELRALNVTDLYHDFIREDRKRARLLGENVGLDMIIQNQSREVQRVANTVRSQQKLREQSEEQSNTCKAETLLFKKKRQETLDETKWLKSKEEQLKQKLKILRSSTGAANTTMETLQGKIAAMNEKKSSLERDVAAAESAHKQQQHERQVMDNALAKEITELRALYVHLKDNLNRD